MSPEAPGDTDEPQIRCSAYLLEKDDFGEVWIPVLGGIPWVLERRGSEDEALHAARTIANTALERWKQLHHGATRR